MPPEFRFRPEEGQHADFLRTLGETFPELNYMGEEATKAKIDAKYPRKQQLLALPLNSDYAQAEWRSLVRKFRPNVALIRQPAEEVLQESDKGLQELLHDAFERSRIQRIIEVDLHDVRRTLANWFDTSLTEEIPEGVRLQRGRFGLYFTTFPQGKCILPLQAAVLDKKYGLSDGKVRVSKEVAMQLDIKESAVNGVLIGGVQKVNNNQDIRRLMRLSQ